MSEAITRYLPSDWQDEVIPTPQKNPNDFLFFTEDHGWHIRPPENDEDDSCFTFLRLEPGQIVKFDLNRVFGDFDLTVNDDRTFDVDGVIPAEANCFRIDHDIYTLQQSLEALVNGDGTPWSNDILEPGTYLMDAYWWSEKSTSFRFEIEDGKGKFVNCAGAS
ncbi:hypothetical protein JNB91_23930 [Rhizobium wenxiniae]|uniref:hypothetical protein n=1 Tax=Rhizobium wenxiniae TaxID=1737357 RepID=UPI001C6E0219|nr:hypothetical protein [Rhizobium wenxiniae]MBW9090866.1 hypothetical protein [Rhizobium wenxiniae]